MENENEAWCSDFTKWVWQRAGVTADMNTLNAGSVSFYVRGRAGVRVHRIARLLT